jgi:phenylacetate-CoA ligase
MKAYTKLVSGLLFPLHERLKGHSTMKAFREMDKNQWLSPVQLQQLQVENLRDFLCKAKSQVPYYRNVFSELNFDPSGVDSIAGLAKLPLLTKDKIRLHTEDLKAEDATDLKRFNTGGSSGEPLIFYLGDERVSHDVAAKLRATRWWNVDLGDREIVVWGSPIELGSQDRLRQARDFLFRTELLSAFEMSPDNLRHFIATIRSKKPHMLFGYPSSLALIAEFAESEGLPLDDLGVRVAFVTSESLYDHQREKIESTFGCPVANGYGGRDAGFIAHQCPEGSMHITSDDIVVEVVNEQGEVLPMGEKGEIVVTHMRTGSFPFIRYRTGDVGALSPDLCACGRSLPVLKNIEGRTTDFIRTADGQVLHGLSLIYVLRDLPAVKSFRIVQESVAKIVVQLVAPGVDTGSLESAISDQFRQRLGPLIDVSFEYYSAIPRDGSGKFRYVVSHVTAADTQGGSACAISS